MMPANTYASELLRKLTKYDYYSELDANQVLISMTESPAVWYNVPLIYLKRKKADSIRKIIGIPKGQKYATLLDFFDDKARYKLAPYLDEAYRAQIPNGFQKEFKETDQRVNLLANTLEGRSLKIFPKADDANNKWLSFVEFEETGYKGLDSVYVQQILPIYFQTLRKAKQDGDFAKPAKLLEGIRKVQEKYGSEVILNKAITILSKVLIGIIIALFVLHTGGLIMRWYISGHAPWSDAYESMIYVAWATMFFGLAFGRKSNLTIAATAFVTSMILMIAHWNWMDPAIANLQPVLDSYWLMIHVAVIVASYGPFTLGMILGIVSLLLMILTTKENKGKMLLNIKELTIINEMSLTVGLVMLTQDYEDALVLT